MADGEDGDQGRPFPKEGSTDARDHLLAQLMRRLQVEQQQAPRPEKVLDDLTLNGIAQLMKKMQSADDKCKVIVMTGAGISTAAGIPDFRSPGTGLYDNLQKYNLPQPQAVFDIGYFRQNPKPFCMLAKELYPTNFKPTLSHYFIRLLAEKGLLLRNFTQNIDSLERRAGLIPDLLVEAHGGFSVAHCVDCGTEYSEDFVKDRVFRDEIPRCTQDSCKDTSSRTEQEKERGGEGGDGEAEGGGGGENGGGEGGGGTEVGKKGTQEDKGARRKDEDERGRPIKGLVKPDIVFFGEALPDRFVRCAKEDMQKCDLLIVMGTSLLVHPFASLVDRVRDDCPRLLINRDKVGQGDPMMRMFGLGGGLDFSEETSYRDVFHKVDCDDGCRELAKMLGWEKELDDMFTAEHAKLDSKQATAD